MRSEGVSCGFPTPILTTLKSRPDLRNDGYKAQKVVGFFCEMMSSCMRMQPRVQQRTSIPDLHGRDEGEDSASCADFAWNTIVIRLSGEIGIKSRPVRSRLERTVTVHIRRALERRKIPFDAILRGPGRVYAKLRYRSAAGHALGMVFGISSFSPALATPSDLDDITSASLQAARSALTKGSAFAVSCRRTGKHNYSSADVQAKVGQAILTSFNEMAVRVDLSRPEVTVGIEVVNERAYVFTKTLPGAGGMPYGSQGKMVAILDGSVRSVVASWLIMRRGSPIVPLLVSSAPDRTQPPREVLRQLVTLADWSPLPGAKCYALWREEPLVASNEGRPANERVLPWAFIYADALSEFEGAEGIVVDERFGLGLCGSGVQAQPLRAYRCARPVYMPLIGFGDQEVERLAEKIGLAT